MFGQCNRTAVRQNNRDPSASKAGGRRAKKPMKLAPPQSAFAATSPERALSSPPPSYSSSYTPLYTRLTSLHIHACALTQTQNTKQTQIVDLPSREPNAHGNAKAEAQRQKSPTSYILIIPSSLEAIKNDRTGLDRPRQPDKQTCGR
jgi:hypothetical protein